MQDGIKNVMLQNIIRCGITVSKDLANMNGFSENKKRRHSPMNKKLRITAVALLLLLVIIMTACGGGFTGNPAIFH